MQHHLHTPEPNEAPPTPTPSPQPTAPPIEDERGPQVPIREPGNPNPPERV